MTQVHVNKGDPNCQHNWSRQDKLTVTILTRVCTKCGKEEIICDNPNIDEATLLKLMKKEKVN